MGFVIMSDEYDQLTIRLPRKLINKIKELSNRWGTNMKDTILIILWDYFEGGE